MFRRKKIITKICNYSLCKENEFFDRIHVCKFDERKIYFGKRWNEYHQLNIEAGNQKIDYMHVKALEPEFILLDKFLNSSSQLQCVLIKHNGLWLPDESL
jgi:hypothetical protein